MDLEEYAQQSLSDSESFQCNHWAKESNHYYYRKKLHTSYSTPININYSNDEVQEKNQFLREIGQVKQDILRFRTEMNGLAKQMDGMETDLNHSKDRVREIEKGLTATQEVNVNLQVLLEKAVNTQRESDVYATRAMRHIHTNLATVVYETGQLKGRISTIADYQKQHQGNVSDVAERMREYTHMLEQAQGTIQSLQPPFKEDVMSSLDIRSYSTDDDDDEEEEEEEENSKKIALNNVEMYRHRIIKKRASNPEIISKAWLPQKGLRILLNDFNSF
ncbi:hypothetical protein MFLAVUS_002669 [Mucor flavus]|uniref:Uncharacterized protein n=1 Tax=Mucor flavus TaxID=439312 RepID=A0ABP9YQX3_9FUNG